MSGADGATILLVEDNPDHAEFAMKALRKGDIPTDVVWAKDGQEALDMLRGNQGPARPDLILLDIHLPKLNGHEVLRRVKDDDALRTIPVVMMSTSDRAEDVATSYNARANSYVTKPVGFKQLVDQVQSVKDYWLRTNRLPV